jgi:hypothetical protein
MSALQYRAIIVVRANGTIYYGDSLFRAYNTTLLWLGLSPFRFHMMHNNDGLC